MLQRLWFLLDLPVNTHRIALIHNPTYFPPLTLNQATLFFLKLDMAFTDPCTPSYPIDHPNFLHHPAKYAGGQPSGVHLRKMLLAERQMTSLWRVLRGWTPDSRDPAIAMTRCDLLRLWIRHKFQWPEGTSESVKGMKVMDILPHEIGTAGLERTGVAFHDLHDPATNTTTKVPVMDPSITSRQAPLYPHARKLILPNTKPREQLLRPDELVMRECIKRQQSMHTKWAEMMLYGFTDKMGKQLPIRSEEEWLRLGKEKAARGVTMASARKKAVEKMMARYGTVDKSADAGGGVEGGKRKAEGEVEGSDGEEREGKKVKTDAVIEEGEGGVESEQT